jgi:murein DD-endopeptidase MepM/ murein hydrolase activator NlpD
MRPIPSGEVNWPHPLYRYGNTFFGESSIHTGVDLSADRGAVVQAAGPGEVIWTGYGLYRGVEDKEDPYGLAIAISHDFGHDGKRLYTIYAHLQSAEVWLGQRVKAGDPIGTVGGTGHASGPHLHFEVRLGENQYFSTRNPELWMVPPEGWGVLAGYVTSTWGEPLAEQLVQIRSIDTENQWRVWTYARETVHPDENYQENFVISDLPAGPYEIKINYVGRSFLSQLFVYPGRTNLVRFKGRNGFLPIPQEVEKQLDEPPIP